MLRDYVGVIAPAIAILNSVIAVAVAQFPPGERQWKFGLLAAAIVLGMAAAAATIGGQYYTIQKQILDKQEKSAKRGALGQFIQQGNAILSILRQQSNPVPVEAVNNWNTAVEGYLSDKLGAGYIERYRDGSGLLHGQPVGIDEERLGYWNGTYERVTRLQQFSAEL